MRLPPLPTLNLADDFGDRLEVPLSSTVTVDATITLELADGSAVRVELSERDVVFASAFLAMSEFVGDRDISTVVKLPAASTANGDTPPQPVHLNGKTRYDAILKNPEVVLRALGLTRNDEFDADGEHHVAFYPDDDESWLPIPDYEVRRYVQRVGSDVMLRSLGGSLIEIVMAAKVTPQVRRKAKEQVGHMLLNERARPANERSDVQELAARIVHNVLAVLIQEGVIE